MKPNLFSDLKNLPKMPTVYGLFDGNGRSLFVGAAENVEADAKKIFAANETLETETSSVEIIKPDEPDLVNRYAATISQLSPVYNSAIQNQILYPHLKITNEAFPRLLATRLIEDDGAEYWGAFLPKTAARYLLGFLIDTFGLRGCDIPIDGNLPVPCPQFYRKKCVAPCVSELCDREEYSDAVIMTRLFLHNKREQLTEFLRAKIEKFSDELEFETAARWHNVSERVATFWENKDSDCTLETAADSFEIKPQAGGFIIYLITRRKRKILGRHTFVVENEFNFSSREILGQIIWQHYRFYTPKEISVSADFPNRKLLEKVLSERAGRAVKISVLKKANQKITVTRALKRAEVEYEIDNIKPPPRVADLQNEFKFFFAFDRNIERIEAFDAAHISGSDLVGAKSVWENGKFLAEEYEFWFSDSANELQTLAEAVRKSFARRANPPDLILIDGGRAQLRAILRDVPQLQNSGIDVISAVKPPQKHNEISHFLLENGQTVEFQKNSDAFSLLLKLRDEAHFLANYIHRSKRETAHFYEVFYALPFLKENERYLLLRKFRSLKAVKSAGETELIEVLGETNGRMIFRELQNGSQTKEPFIVPIRYDDANGEAANLQPLFTTGNR